MPFGIPNAPPGSTFEVQVQGSPDSVDFDALTLGYQGTGTVSGCAVTAASSGLAVVVASGVIAYAGVQTVIGGGTVTLATADPSNPRLDLIVVNTSGLVLAVAGTPSATNPVFPSISGQVLLAAVDVAAAATSLTSAELVDKRVQIGPALLARVAVLESRCDNYDLVLQRIAAAMFFLDVDLDQFDDFTDLITI